MLFVNKFKLTIDAKQRLAIPAEIRERLDPKRDGEALYASLSQGPTLCLYTEADFERRSKELDGSEWPADEVLLYENMTYPEAARLVIDKQGRIRLPEDLLEMVSLGREVVLVGMKDHLQVHDRKEYYERRAELIRTRPDLLMNPRRMLRRAADGDSNDQP